MTTFTVYSQELFEQFLAESGMTVERFSRSSCCETEEYAQQTELVHQAVISRTGQGLLLVTLCERPLWAPPYGVGHGRYATPLRYGDRIVAVQNNRLNFVDQSV